MNFAGIVFTIDYHEKVCLVIIFNFNLILVAFRCVFFLVQSRRVVWLSVSRASSILLVK